MEVLPLVGIGQVVGWLTSGYRNQMKGFVAVVRVQ